MTVETNSMLGHGGSGFQGTGSGSAAAMLKELQALTVSVLAGATANTKINLAAIRNTDTIASALQFAAGVPSDITGTMSIEDVRASGTVTAAGVLANDTVTVNGRVYTFKAEADCDVLAADVPIGVDNDTTAANLAEKINQLDSPGGLFFAAAAAAVVTIRAYEEGTGPNAYTLASSNGTRLAVSGATLTGGTTTGGVKSSNNTSGNTIVLVWFNKQ